MRLLNILKCLYRLPEFRETIMDSNERLKRHVEVTSEHQRSTDERLHSIDLLEAQVEELQEYTSAVTRDRVEPMEAELKGLRERLHNIATEGDFPDQYYVDFEDLFRGSPEEIEVRLKAYLPHIENNKQLPKDKPAIDLGCGRGEWLDLLSGQSFVTVGVDLNAQFFDDCASRGHTMHNGDALDYLVSCEDESSSIVSAFHLIEHLPNRVLVDLVRQAFRVLAPGGMLILESPNPRNIAVSADTFYLDPTHTVPRHPHTMQFLVTRCGFSDVEILYLSENRMDPVTPFDVLEKQLEDQGAKQALAFLREKFFAAPDYAIVAVKS